MKTNMIRKTSQLNNKGFTLIEVIIAMTVLVIVSIPLLDTLSGTTTVTRKASNRQRATLTAQTISEGIKRYSTLDLCEAFVNTTDVDAFPILNSTQYPFVGFSRLKLNGDGKYQEDNRVTENSRKYIYGIYDITTGISRYDALITLDSAIYEDINAEVIPEIVNIGAPGTGLIDITGVYNGEDIIKEIKDYVESDQNDKQESFEPNRLKVKVDVVIRKNTTPVISYEVYGNVRYTYTYASGTSYYIVPKDYVGSRTMDSEQKLNYVYVLLGDENIGGENELNFHITADESENIPVAIVTGNNSDVTWNMNVVEYSYDGGTPVETYNWRDAVMFFTNADESKINFRNRAIANALKDYGTSGNKLKRIYSLKVDLYGFKENLQDKFQGEPIDSMTSSYLRIDVEDFNDDRSKSE